MKPLSLHKNAETVNKSYIIASMSLLRSVEEKKQAPEKVEEMIGECIDDVIGFFGTGLSSKRAEGKQHCRKALVAIKKIVAAEKFKESVSSIPVAMTQSIIQKEVSKTTFNSVSSSKQNGGNGIMDGSSNSFPIKRRKLGLTSSWINEENFSNGNDKNKSRLTEIFSKATIGFEKNVEDRDNSNICDNEHGTKNTSPVKNGNNLNAAITTNNITTVKKTGGVAAIVNIGYDQNDDVGGFNF